MNTAENIHEFTQLPAEQRELQASQQIGDLMLNIPMLQQIDAIAERMATSKCTIPSHFRNNPGDCYAVAMQAIQWRMNPYSVAQKTHVSQSGVLGYEAQLINAVVTTNGPIAKRPDYEFLGDWNKILGKVKEMSSEKGGKYYVANWDKSLEEGLGVICRCWLKGESTPREITVMLSQCYPRFSTQWATDPQQQITYVSIRKWARRYCPDVILGVYTPDELDGSLSERDITPTPAPSPTAPEMYSDEKFDANFPAWEKMILDGKKTAEHIVVMVSKRENLTEAQRQKILAVKIPEAETVE